MNTASQNAGPHQGETGKPDAPPRTGSKPRPKETAGKGAPRTRNRAAKTAAKRAPKKDSIDAGKPAPAASAPPASDGGERPPATEAESSAPEKEEPGTERTGNGGGASGGNGSGGSGPSGGGPAEGPDFLSWPGTRYALYGLAGLAGGALVAAVLLLTGGGGLRDQMQALETRIENAEVAVGDPEQVAAMRRRIEELGSRIDALANLSASEPLVQQVSDISAAVSKLQGRVEEPEQRTGAKGPVARVRRNELSANLEQISEELVQLDTRLSKLAGEVTRSGARLSGRLEALEAATPEELPKLLDQWSGTVRDLQKRIAQLERDEMTRDVRRASLALALANLTRATETSQPFVNELKAIEVLDPEDRLVDALKPYAESGLPSVPALAGRFDKVADEVVRVWRKEHGRGFFEWLWDSIVNLFSVRPVGDVEGGTAPQIVARAEQRLEEGELQPALQELEKLGEKEKAAAAEWLDAAQARVRLDNLVAEVNQSVLEEIAGAEAERKAREADFVPAGPSGPAEPAAGALPEQQDGPPEKTPEAESAPERDGGASETKGGANGASER